LPGRFSRKEKGRGWRAFHQLESAAQRARLNFSLQVRKSARSRQLAQSSQLHRGEGVHPAQCKPFVEAQGGRVSGGRNAIHLPGSGCHYQRFAGSARNLAESSKSRFMRLSWGFSLTVAPGTASVIPSKLECAYSPGFTFGALPRMARLPLPQDGG